MRQIFETLRSLDARFIFLCIKKFKLCPHYSSYLDLHPNKKAIHYVRLNILNYILP